MAGVMSWIDRLLVWLGTPLTGGVRHSDLKKIIILLFLLCSFYYLLLLFSMVKVLIGDFER
jgi:hypothetical protein